jgi:purine-binding chemotaxis protein CheW
VAQADAGPLLAFRVGDERFGVPAAIVGEVARLPRVTRVPHAPASLIGLGNFRGTVLPIVSFAGLTDRVAGSERRVILLDTANPIALAVDEVTALGDETGLHRIDVEALTARDFAGDGRRKARAVGRAEEAGAEAASTHVPLVAFAVAGQEYALPIGAVEEVLPLPGDVALMPHADDVVIGSIAVRDALLPLLSLQALLALPGAAAVARPRVVVVRIGAHRVGLVVDAMRAILRVAESDIDQVPAVLARGNAEARIQAICRLDEGRRLVSVLAVEHLVREDLTARLLQGAETKMAEREETEASEQFLLFRIGEEEFGLPVASVIEVAMLPPRLTRLPNAPDFVQGVMNLRGQVVPVIDQARRFGGVAAAGVRRRVIVVRLGELQAGFVVEAVSEVMRVPAGALRPAPELGGEETRVFDRVANLAEAGRMVLIVSPQELLDRAERELLATLDGKMSAPS